jgi:16S rRNA (uracil1498-N3)-methyltransferase
MQEVRAAIEGLSEGERPLDAASARYVAGVLRLRAGDRFVAFDPARGIEADATVVRVDDAGVVACFEAPRAARLTADVPVAWIQGLPKGDKPDAIVRDVTELGATLFVAAATERAVVRLDAARAAQRRERWERIAREAARQSGRGDAPRVAPPCTWREALALVPSDIARFCLYERATAPLAPPLLAALEARQGLAFAVGPEGGLTDDEVAAARDAGWVVTSLGPFILRTETVAAAVLGAVRVWTGGLPSATAP